jgi:hypothetical protein
MELFDYGYLVTTRVLHSNDGLRSNTSQYFPGFSTAQAATVAETVCQLHSHNSSQDSEAPARCLSQSAGNMWVTAWQRSEEGKCKAIPVTDRGGLQGCEMLRIPQCLDSRLTGDGEAVSFTHRPCFTHPNHIHIPSLFRLRLLMSVYAPFFVIRIPPGPTPLQLRTPPPSSWRIIQVIRGLYSTSKINLINYPATIILCLLRNVFLKFYIPQRNFLVPPGAPVPQAEDH